MLAQLTSLIRVYDSSVPMTLFRNFKYTKLYQSLVVTISEIVSVGVKKTDSSVYHLVDQYQYVESKQKF